MATTLAFCSDGIINIVVNCCCCGCLRVSLYVINTIENNRVELKSIEQLMALVLCAIRPILRPNNTPIHTTTNLQQYEPYINICFWWYPKTMANTKSEQQRYYDGLMGVIILDESRSSTLFFLSLDSNRLPYQDDATIQPSVAVYLYEPFGVVSVAASA